MLLNLTNRKDGTTCIHEAVIKNRYRVIADLVYAGVDINIRDNKERTAIDLALELEHKECYNMLNKVKSIKFNIKKTKVTPYKVDNNKDESFIKKIGESVCNIFNKFKNTVKNKLKGEVEDSCMSIKYTEGLSDSRIESIIIDVDEVKELKLSINYHI